MIDELYIVSLKIHGESLLGLTHYVFFR